MRRVREAREPVGYHDLMRDLRHPGCPVCRGAGRAAWQHIDSILWEMVNDPGVRARLRGAHGFCREHALMALSVAREQAAALGMAIMYEDFLRHVREDAVRAVRSRARTSRRGRGRKTTGLDPHAGCPACESAARVADNYLRILAAAPADREVGQAARGDQRGLCFPHLRHGLESVTSLEGAEHLLELFLHGEADLRRDLAEFVRKHDYRFRSEGLSRGEKSSWARAVYRLVGDPLPRARPER